MGEEWDRIRWPGPRLCKGLAWLSSPVAPHHPLEEFSGPFPKNVLCPTQGKTVLKGFVTHHVALEMTSL